MGGTPGELSTTRQSVHRSPHAHDFCQSSRVMWKPGDPGRVIHKSPKYPQFRPRTPNSSAATGSVEIRGPPASYPQLASLSTDPPRRHRSTRSARPRLRPVNVRSIRPKTGVGGDQSAARQLLSLLVRVLVIGSGAREHALLLALSLDPAVVALACAPGNAGTAAVAESYGVDVADPASIADLAVEWQAGLVVIGPEVPLVAGAADAVRAKGIPCFGPSAAAARIEGSKAFAKEVMAAAGVATAHSEIVDNPARLDAALRHFGQTWVVKDDGLAAGKGVAVTDDLAAARAHAMTMLDGCHPVLLETYLD